MGGVMEPSKVMFRNGHIVICTEGLLLALHCVWFGSKAMCLVLV